MQYMVLTITHISMPWFTNACIIISTNRCLGMDSYLKTNLLKMLGKKSPNGGLMVIHHGRKYKSP